MDIHIFDIYRIHVWIGFTGTEKRGTQPFSACVQSFSGKIIKLVRSFFLFYFLSFFTFSANSLSCAWSQNFINAKLSSSVRSIFFRVQLIILWVALRIKSGVRWEADLSAVSSSYSASSTSESWLSHPSGTGNWSKAYEFNNCWSLMLS